MTSTYPLITHPTDPQRELIPAVLSPNDVLLRAHTGSGKSFGLLLALMAKPRIVFRNNKDSEAPDSRGRSTASNNGIASLVIVPSNELAEQYLEWVRQLVPKNIGLDAIIQTLVRGDGQDEEQRMQRLVKQPPHILVATPTRAMQVLQGSAGSTTTAGASILGIPTLRTLVFDEVDALLDLPGRFPSDKAVWRNMVHPPVGLQLLNEIMKIRGTHSGGSPMSYQGLEDKPSWSKRDYYGKQAKLKRSPNYSWLAPPRQVDAARGEWPLQLVACSASANAVLRHFLGAKTGWARVGVRAAPEQGAAAAVRFGARRGVQGESRPVTGRWIDLTGLTLRRPSRQTEQWSSYSQGQQERLAANTSLAGVMPQELIHHCLVLDEAAGEGGALPLRNLPISRLRRLVAKEQKEERRQEHRAQREGAAGTRASEASDASSSMVRIVQPTAPAIHEVDPTLLEALALVYAQLGVQCGIAFIPPQWSLRTVLSTLSNAYGVEAVTVDELRRDEHDGGGAPRLAILQATSARGLDLPGVSHVFLVGAEAVGDTVRYVHLAGRAARLSATREKGSTERPVGTVVSLVRGLGSGEVKENRDRAAARNESTAGEGELQSWSEKGAPLMASSERKMWSMYQRLGIRCSRLKMGEWAEMETEEGEDSEAEDQEAEVAANVA